MLERVMNLNGRTVLVTGASRGIGRAITKGFLDIGDRVIGISTTSDYPDEFKGDHYTHLKLDVGDQTAIKHFLTRVPEGFKNIDILVNNAGIMRDTELLTSTQEDWDAVMDINLRAVYFITQLLSPIIAKSKSGRIINIASQSGIAHSTSKIEYGLSKSGVIYLTQSFAKILAKDHVTVNAVSPGRTYTDMTSYHKDPAKLKRRLENIPLGAINTPEEIASAVVYFASDAARNITGQTLSIDGGECLF
jgi:3-oxoacyl-[acyl-carrier protein] reductase